MKSQKLLQTSRIVQSKNINSILENIKLEVNNERLELTSSNGEINIKSTILRYQNDKEIFRDIEPGAILINAYMITEITRRLDSREISFAVEDDAIARIVNDKSNYNINILKAEEYSEIDFDESGIEFKLKRNDLINAVNQVSFAASTKENRKVLTAVHIESDEDFIYFIATDGARLAKKQISCPGILPFKVNVSSKLLNEAIKSLQNEEYVTIFVSSNRILFIFNDSVVTMNLILGDYPNTKTIIPTNYYYVLETNSDDFLKTCDRIALFSSTDRENIVKLTMSNEEVIVSSKSQQKGNGSDILQLFNYSGERLEISFNVEYIEQAIRALKSAEIEIRFLGEMKPFMIISKTDNSVVQLITPVRTY